MSPRVHPARIHPASCIILVALAALLCGTGAAAARTIQVASAGPDTGVTLRAQRTTGVELHYRMSDFGLEPVEVDGQPMQTVTLPGVILPNDAGAPDLPGLGRFVAMPQGATATVTITAAERRVFPGIDVAPAPVIPLENQDGPLTYERNAAIYGQSAYYPGSPVVVSAPRKIRGVDVVALGITPFQYNPVTRELVVYTDLAIRVDFHGGNGHFGEDRLRSRYWEPLLRGQIVNYESLPPVDFGAAPDRNRYGWEYVILCPDDPAFTAWADTLRTWRKLQGISTEVFTTTETGTTPEAIEAWLDNAYTTWETPPAAFLILGDYPDSGDRTPGVIAPIWNNYCVSDNIYADVDGDDLPDMAHGRICARNASELETMIGKMLTYERQPYTDEGFYDHPLIAGGWQTERWFILCCEVIYGHQANVLGKHPVREYAIYEGAPGNIWSSNGNTPMVVEYFGPEGLGYIPETPNHLDDWGGNATRINNDINAGAYMVVHRDHGLETGWGEPDYTTTNLADLHNEMYPFVFTLNCLTGKYNWASACFSEVFHRMEHGALGLIAASETSYSFVNDAFAWGLFDGLWPDFMPGYADPRAGNLGAGLTGAGDPGADNIGRADLRTAFAMAYGKYFLEQSSWPSNPESKDVTYNLFHHFGDAFMTLYSEVPQPLDVYHYDTCPLGTDVFAVRADEGAVISLTVDGEIIGVADATGAIQSVPIIPQTQPGTLRVTVTKANHYRYDVTVPVGGTLFTVKPDGTGDYPTIQAAIDAAAPGVVIELTDGVFTGDDNRDIDFQGKAIEIRSRSANPAACVIDCLGGASDPQRGFVFHSGETPSSQLSGVTIRNGYDSFGAGLYCADATPTITNCVFEGNSGGWGGAVYLSGGGGATFDHCVFRDNVAREVDGGAISLAGAASALTYCTFTGNSALEGGAVRVSGASLSCANCTFFENTTLLTTKGTIAVSPDASALLDHCIVAFAPNGMAVSTYEGGTTLSCCDLYGNADGDWVGGIAGQLGVAGNFSEDPLFCDAPALELTLSSASYCAPGTHPECGLIGAWGVGCEPPTYEIAPDGSGDYPTIQAAVDAATTGTTIELLGGTFTGDGNRDIDLGQKRVVIRAHGEDARTCVIDCEGSASAPHRGFVVDGGQDWRTVLEKITVRGGFAAGAEMGGAVYVGPGSGPTLTGCIFLSSTAEGSGGAVALDAGSAKLEGCTFAGNTAGGGGAIYAGGPSAPSVSGCTLQGNAAGEGGGIYAGDSVILTLENTIIAFGEAGGAVACGATGAAQATCCDVYGNEGGDWVGCLEGQLALEGNLAEDPGFCDAAGGVFTVYDDSPCAAENNPECGQIGAWGVDCARPLFVKPDGTGSYPTIQAAIDAAVTGMTIELDDGVFTGTGNRDLNCHGKVLTIRSRSGNPDDCVIDAQASVTNQHVILRFHMGEDQEMVVEGITMRGGYSGMGGALFISASSPTFRHCAIHSNTASGGGAVYVYHQCAPRFINCTFSHNTGSAGMGGTFFLNDNANVVFDNCLITYSLVGAAFNIISSSPVFTCCDIYGNAGGDWTGVIAGQYGINGNVSVDPLYCDAPGRNFMIDETSPCAPENNPGCGLIGALDVGCYSSDAPVRSVPLRLMLAAQSPSAAASGAAIRYAIPGAGATHVRLSVYDATGRLVRALVDGPRAPGFYTLVWDGRTASGAQAGSGVYFCRLSCNGEIRTRNVVLVR